MNMSLPIVLVLGVVGCFGLWWQVKVIRNDFEHIFESRVTRVTIPAIVGTIIWVGSILYVLVRLFADKHNPMEFEQAYEIFIKISIFCLILVFKAYLGALFATYAVATELYFLMTYGELHQLPLITALFDWLFDFVPIVGWISVAYTIIAGLYTSISSAIDTVNF